jgi:hypothetical protein
MNERQMLRLFRFIPLFVFSDSIPESAFYSPATTMTATNLSKEKTSPSILSFPFLSQAFSNPTLESARLFTCYHNDESNKPACKKKKKVTVSQHKP